MPDQTIRAVDFREPVGLLRLEPTVALAVLPVMLTSVLVDRQHIRDAKKSAGDIAAPDSSPLGLGVTAEDQQIEVFWNRRASAIQDAENATIRISDGDVAESVLFDGGQLRDGVLIYRPRTNDVGIRMEVKERDGQRVSESVRSVSRP